MRALLGFVPFCLGRVFLVPALIVGTVVAVIAYANKQKSETNGTEKIKKED
ncbi:MAG: hypothetical protein HQK53_11770 [Oligoflexia bacterium]|nr:hypothetical protein [Oligoflexia bacterium]